MPAKKMKKKAGSKGIKVTVVLKKEKKKKSAAEMKRERLEEKREMAMDKALLAALKKKR